MKQFYIILTIVNILCLIQNVINKKIKRYDIQYNCHHMLYGHSAEVGGLRW